MGAVEHRTSARDLNTIGGLASMMPLTAVAALVASLSISGMPLFSGFSSKWLIYHVSILGGRVSAFAVAFGLVAIFISIATLAACLKLVTTAFLGALRVPGDREQVKEVSATMAIPQVVLGVFCVLFGVLPILAVRPIYKAVAGVFGSVMVPDFASIFGDGWFAGLQLATTAGYEGAWVPWPVLVGLAATALVAYALYRSGGAETMVSPVWHCGEEHDDEETAYRAHSLFRPFKDLLNIQIGSVKTEGLWPKLPPLKAPNLGWLQAIFDFDKWAYYPLVRLGRRFVKWVSTSHVGIAQMYLLWMIVGIIAAVVVLLSLGQV
jgi:NADH:ubiquinone oxidoreductase subunit 5 (subunit L)/multisubunit Na+/H+ antiporter MnhA subunit